MSFWWPMTNLICTPEIARLAGMKIVTRFKRPVLNRVEKDRSHAYSETIFHLKEKNHIR